MIEEVSLPCPKTWIVNNQEVGILGLVRGTYKTGEEMDDALKSLPSSSLPRDYRPMGMFEFSASSPMRGIGKFVLVHYNDGKKDGVVSHYFSEINRKYERIESTNALRFFEGRWNFSSEIQASEAPGAPTHDKYVREYNRSLIFLLTGDQESMKVA